MHIVYLPIRIDNENCEQRERKKQVYDNVKIVIMYYYALHLYNVILYRKMENLKCI